MILFRADANPKIGLGHIMRCLTIADAMAVTSNSTILPRGKQDIILSSIEELADDYERRVEVGQKMQSMIDGFGDDRMVEEIMKTT